MAKLDVTQCDLGIVGLDVVSRNLALNFKDHQFKVAVWDPAGAPLPSDRIPSAASLAELTGMLRAPRTILLFKAPNSSTDATINELMPLLGDGDVLVDAGQSHFKDTLRRSQQLGPKSVSFMALGVAGGETGARWGSIFTAGGSYQSHLRTRHLWEAIAAEHDGLPCVSYVGCAAAAHFANMVHAGIECGLTQLLSETFDLLKATLLLTDEELDDLSGAWHIGVLKGRLMEISGRLLNPTHGQTGRLQLADRLERARTDETVRWIEQSARELEVQTPSIDATVGVESAVTWERQRAMVSSPVRQPRGLFRDDSESVLDELHRALWAGTIVTYAEGLAVLEAARLKHGFQIYPSDIVRVWKGCATLRTTVLDDISEAMRATPSLRNVLGDEDLSEKVMEHQEFLRHAVWRASELNTVVPAMLAAVDYLDSQKDAWLPANLVQVRHDQAGPRDETQMGLSKYRDRQQF
jgi:6-phosphogluconate dehydrogenase